MAKDKMWLEMTGEVILYERTKDEVKKHKFANELVLKALMSVLEAAVYQRIKEGTHGKSKKEKQTEK